MITGYGVRDFLEHPLVREFYTTSTFAGLQHRFGTKLKMAVLGEYIRLHVEQEQEDIFPKMRACGLNLRALGDQMRARRRALMSATIVLGEVLTTSL